jgi:transcriptional/translational regulatory protein YebC/TACO1
MDLVSLSNFSARATPVMFMFQRRGCVLVKLEKIDTNEVVEGLVGIALDAGADDFDKVESGDDAYMLKASIIISQPYVQQHTHIFKDSSPANLMHWQD